jgi:hypothetical protein
MIVKASEMIRKLRNEVAEVNLQQFISLQQQ